MWGGVPRRGLLPKGVWSPHFDPSGPLGQLGAGLVVVSSSPHGLVFSSLVDGHGDRAPSLPLLGAERGRPGRGVPLPPSSLWPAALFPHLSSLSASVCPPEPSLPLYPSSSFSLLPFPHLLAQLAAGGQVTLFPVALHSRDSRAAGNSHGDSVTGRRSRAGPDKRPSLEGGGGHHAVGAGSQTLAAPRPRRVDDITGWLSLVKSGRDK